MDYETSDLYIAAYIKTLQYKITTAKKEGRRTIFAFNGTREELEPLVMEYLNGEGSITPLLYVNAIKDLKGIIYRV